VTCKKRFTKQLRNTASGAPARPSPPLASHAAGLNQLGLQACESYKGDTLPSELAFNLRWRLRDDLKLFEPSHDLRRFGLGVAGTDQGSICRAVAPGPAIPLGETAESRYQRRPSSDAGWSRPCFRRRCSARAAAASHSTRWRPISGGLRRHPAGPQYPAISYPAPPPAPAGLRHPGRF
jgi:hypothetical protein